MYVESEKLKCDYTMKGVLSKANSLYPTMQRVLMEYCEPHMSIKKNVSIFQIVFELDCHLIRCFLDSIPRGSISKLLYMPWITFWQYRSQFIPLSSFPTWRLVTTSLLTYVQCNLEGINIIGSIIVVKKNNNG